MSKLIRLFSVIYQWMYQSVMLNFDEWALPVGFGLIPYPSMTKNQYFYIRILCIEILFDIDKK